MVGATISHYKITDKLGEGGMGVVYKAEDTRLKRTVALKFLSSRALGGEEQKERFLREAQAAAVLDHPNIAAVHDIGEEDGHTFMAIAFVDGPELSDKIKERPLKLDEALDITIQICEGLKEAHEQGVTHRDIKPQNIMLTRKGRVKITDFGLAHLAGRSKLTKSGTSLGTPAYMSPEQALSEDTDRRSDIWGVGVVVYEMLAGHAPFDSDYEQAMVYSIINEPHEPLTAVRTGLPTELDRVVGKALAKRPEERYQHIDDFLVDLRRLRKSLATETKSTTLRLEPVTPPATPTEPVAAQQPIAQQEAERPSSGNYTPVPPPTSDRKAWLPWTLFAASMIALLIVAFGPLTERSADERPLRRFTIEPLQRMLSGINQRDVSISPSGHLIAFVAGERGQLWIRDLETGVTRLVPGTQGIRSPFWSHDSEFLLFETDNELRKVGVDGGSSMRVCETTGNVYGAAASPDGTTIVFGAGAPPETPCGSFWWRHAPAIALRRRAKADGCGRECRDGHIRTSVSAQGCW